MRVDEGLWFLDGIIVTKAVKDKAWQAHTKKWERLYGARERVVRRHQKAMAVFEKAFRRLNARRPYTPWVGHVNEGQVEAYMAMAQREWRRRQQELKHVD